MDEATVRLIALRLGVWVASGIVALIVHLGWLTPADAQGATAYWGEQIASLLILCAAAAWNFWHETVRTDTALKLKAGATTGDLQKALKAHKRAAAKPKVAHPVKPE